MNSSYLTALLNETDKGVTDGLIDALLSSGEELLSTARSSDARTDWWNKMLMKQPGYTSRCCYKNNNWSVDCTDLLLRGKLLARRSNQIILLKDFIFSPSWLKFQSLSPQRHFDVQFPAGVRSWGRSVSLLETWWLRGQVLLLVQFCDFRHGGRHFLSSSTSLHFHNHVVFAQRKRDVRQ